MELELRRVHWNRISNEILIVALEVLVGSDRDRGESLLPIYRSHRAMSNTPDFIHFILFVEKLVLVLHPLLITRDNFIVRPNQTKHIMIYQLCLI
jgi:hypothetical protein